MILALQAPYPPHPQRRGPRSALVRPVAPLIALLVAGVLVLGGCASGGTPSRTSGTASDGEAIIGDPDGLEIGGLPPRQLEEGECGLFLFTPRPTARFVFFANAARATGEMRINGDLVTFARTATDGEVFDQHFAESEYRAAAQGLVLSLSLRPAGRMQGGTRVESGAIRVRKTDGWSMVVPVAGATACGPQG